MKRILSFSLMAALLFCTPEFAVTAGAVQITGVVSDLTAPPMPGDTFRLTITAGGDDAENLTYRFYRRAGYGTPAWAENQWDVAQDWSPADWANFGLTTPGNDYVISQVIPHGESWEAGDPQGGFNVVSAGAVQITAVTSDLTSAPHQGDTFRLTVHAVTTETATLRYRFYYKAGYGTAAFKTNDWQVVQDWSTTPWVDYSFPGPGNYYLVGQVATDGELWKTGDPQGGFNVTVIDDGTDPIDRPEGWMDETHGNNVSPNYDAAFPQGVVKRIDLIIAPDDWQTMMDDGTENLGAFGGGFGGFSGGFPGGGDPEDWMMNFPTPIYRPCTFMVDGKTWWHVGVRFKGNSSLAVPWMMGIMKIPFRFDMDEYEDDYPNIRNQRFYGFKELSLSSNGSDNSLLREKVASDCYREAGVPTPQTAFYRLFVDHGEGPIYFGLYTMVEVPREPLFDSQFGDTGGNLYKPEGEGAKWVTFDEESFVKQNNESENDWSDITAAFAALHAPRNDPAAWRAGMEAVFNVDGFLNWLAVNTVIQNWDTYGNMPQNYYLYSNPSDGLLHWIPWDFNEALKSRSFVANPLPLSLDTTEVDDDWPLIRYLMDDPVYRDIYVAYVNSAINEVFSVTRQHKRLRDGHALIAPYVVGPEGELPGYTFLPSPDAFNVELSLLLSHAEQRNAAGLAFLADEKFTATKIVINEIHYHPSAAQGGEDYEFIELFNAGTSQVDLTDFTFVDGIEFTFPPFVSIVPGEYIVLANNPLAYIGQGYQVLGWTEGRLSNGGEQIRLHDARGIGIDRVHFEDEAPWPTEPDGNGPSLELIDAADDNTVPENWKSSSSVGGTPGRSNF